MGHSLLPSIFTETSVSFEYDFRHHFASLSKKTPTYCYRELFLSSPENKSSRSRLRAGVACGQKIESSRARVACGQNSAGGIAVIALVVHVMHTCQ